MHPVIAHTPAELATAFVVPAASLVDLFAIDPPAWPRAASAPSETTPQCACGPRLYSSTCPTRPPRPTTNPMPVIHQPTATPRNARPTPMAITSGHQLHGEKWPYSPAPSATSATGSASGRASMRRPTSARSAPVKPHRPTQTASAVEPTGGAGGL